MNKQELKKYVIDMLLLDVWEIDNLMAGEYENKETQEIWNNFKKDTRELIECHIRGFFYHSITGYIFSSLFEKLNNYKLNDNDNDDYVDNKGNIKFTSFDYLNVNFDSVVDAIVEFEFMK